MERLATRTLWSRGLIVMFVMGVSLGLWAGALAAADKASQNRSRRPASGWPANTTKDKDLDAAIQDKLRRILANQQIIQQKADAIKQELGIIKIRASSPCPSCTS